MRIFNTNYYLKNNINVKIVLISDIHYYNKNDLKHLNKVLENIKKISPDYICIPGDTVDESNIYDEDILINWLTELATISKVIMSLGNHEFYVRKNCNLNKKYFEKLKNIANLFLLDNQNLVINNINFIGVTLPSKYYHEEDNKNIDFSVYLKDKYIDKNYYNILLCHSPLNICNEELLKKYDFNLILCGHTHGGITPRILRPIFKNYGIISPSKSLFIKNAYGHIKKCKTDIIVTSGITVVSHKNKFRFLKPFFSSEIVSVNIKENKKN